MPLTHLGQLKPTMQQQIALQRALLALRREDEEMRRKAAERPVGEPALARRLVTEGPKPYAGPVSGLPERREKLDYPPTIPPTRAPLERALEPSTPAPDWQAEAWERREEIVEERKTKAKGLYDRLLPLNEEGREIVLKAAPRELIRAMEQEGYISPEGVLAEPEKEKEVINVSTWTDESGWLQQTTTYSDGTTETKTLGRGAKEEVKGMTESEKLGWARLQFDVEKAGEPYVVQAMDKLPEMPTIGEVMPDGTTVTDKNIMQYQKNYWIDVKSVADRLRVEKEGINSVEDAKIMFQHDPEAIKNVQRNIPGMTVDGIWTDELASILYDLFFKEE